MTAHWDFAYGPGQLGNLLDRLEHPMLACNVAHQDDERPAYRPSTIIERAGLRTGVVGIAASIVDKTMPAHFSQGLRFMVGREEVREEIVRLREQQRVDLVIVLSHLGFPQDCELAQEIPGIDVLLSGHTHNRLARPFMVGRTLIIQSGAHGSFIGRLDLKWDGGRIRDVAHQLIRVDEHIDPDPEMTQVIDRLLTPDRQRMSEQVGHTRSLLHRGTVLHAPMDDLLLEAICETAETPLAFSNGWRFGAPIAPGPIMRGDLWNIVPPNPPIQTVELLGSELRDMLEENLERTFARDPYRQQGGYVKRMRGLQAYIKIENPPGGRIQELFADGQPVAAQRRYRAAFLTTQAVPERYGQDRQTLPTNAIDALEGYLSSREYVSHGSRTVVAV